MESTTNQSNAIMEEGDQAMSDMTEPQQAPHEDEGFDEAPAFLTADEAVEVEVDDNDIPMEEDDDDDDVAAVGDDVVLNDEPANDDAATVEDMSALQLTSHTGPVYTVDATVVDAGNQVLVVSGGGDDKAYFYQIAANPSVANTGTVPQTKRLEHAHTDSVSAVALNLPYVSPDDTSKTARLIAVGAFDGIIALYNADDGNKVQTFEGPTDIEWLAFHPKGGSVLLAGSSDGTVWMYHIPMKKCLQVFVGHESAVTAGNFSVDGRWALSASNDGTLRMWAPRTGASKHVFRLGDSGAGLTCLALQEAAPGGDSQLVLVGAEDGKAYVCHIGTKKVVATLVHYEVPNNMQDEDEEMELPTSVEAVAFSSPQPNWCATGGVDGVLKIWDLSFDGGQCRQVCRPTSNDGGITRLRWHPTLPLCLTSTTRGTIDFWDARSGRLLHTLTGHTDVVLDMKVQWLQAGKTGLFVSGSDDQTIRLFEVDVATLWEKANVEQTSSSTS